MSLQSLDDVVMLYAKKKGSCYAVSLGIKSQMKKIPGFNASSERIECYKFRQLLHDIYFYEFYVLDNSLNTAFNMCIVS